MMNTTIRNQPLYVFCLTPEISLIWTTLGSFLLILAAAGASWYYATIHGQTVSFSVENAEGEVWRGIFAFLSLVVITFATTVIHELIHGIAFAAFGGSPRYGFKFQYFLPLAYATAPGETFRRNDFIVIALAPLLVIDVVCLLLLAIFPQATWLIWVIAFNTGGAIGDIWIAVQLLRCPKPILVEDREEGIAIYASASVTRRNLPFARTDESRASLGMKALLNLSLITLGLILIFSFLLIPLLETLGVPSFIIGIDSFWFLRWVNTAEGFGLEFNLGFFIILIMVLFLPSLLKNLLRRL
jgi:Putative zincin peptidase